VPKIVLRERRRLLPQRVESADHLPHIGAADERGQNAD
jgi:hypothetical protein